MYQWYIASGTFQHDCVVQNVKIFAVLTVNFLGSFHGQYHNIYKNYTVIIKLADKNPIF